MIHFCFWYKELLTYQIPGKPQTIVSKIWDQTTSVKHLVFCNKRIWLEFVNGLVDPLADSNRKLCFIQFTSFNSIKVANNNSFLSHSRELTTLLKVSNKSKFFHFRNKSKKQVLFLSTPKC